MSPHRFRSHITTPISLPNLYRSTSPHWDTLQSPRQHQRNCNRKQSHPSNPDLINSPQTPTLPGVEDTHILAKLHHTMADLQRKIELQEPDDLRYLLANTRRVAGSKIDIALPPIEGEDVLRQKVEELVNSVRPPPPPSALSPAHPHHRDSTCR